MSTKLTFDEIKAARRLLADRVVTTPVVELASGVTLKLELFQRTGSFKARGALLNMLHLSETALKRGVTAISAGNHAIAVAYAAQTLGTRARVVMLKTANPFRVQAARNYGAEVEFAENGQRGFERVKELEAEGFAFIHPFDGVLTVTGTATVGLELTEQVAPLEAVVVPIGGGGLCAGVASAIKLCWPECSVFGVEPEGADSMRRSFAAGKPMAIDRVDTIADSLGAPYATQMTFELCREHLDDLVTVNDDQLRAAMRTMFEECKLAVEPAGAAAMAAFLGPLRERLHGRRVGLIVCGSNIDLASYADVLSS
jgi:threonine dehydratase